METSQLRWLYRFGVDTIRYEGLHILLWRMLKLGLSPLGALDILSFCRKDLAQPLEQKLATVHITISQATEEDIDELVTLVTQRYGPEQRRRLFKPRSIEETVRDQIGQGARCFVGRIGTEIVHYNWIFFHKKEWSPGACRITLSDHEALCDDAYTVEAWRGRAIHGAVHNQMLLFLQESGFRTAYTLVSATNIASKKALQSLGWCFYGTLLYFMIHKSERVLAWQLRGPLHPFAVKGSSDAAEDGMIQERLTYTR